MKTGWKDFDQLDRDLTNRFGRKVRVALGGTGVACDVCDGLFGQAIDDNGVVVAAVAVCDCHLEIVLA